MFCGSINVIIIINILQFSSKAIYDVPNLVFFEEFYLSRVVALLINDPICC